MIWCPEVTLEGIWENHQLLENLPLVPVAFVARHPKVSLCLLRIALGVPAGWNGRRRRGSEGGKLVLKVHFHSSLMSRICPKSVRFKFSDPLLWLDSSVWEASLRWKPCQCSRTMNVYKQVLPTNQVVFTLPSGGYFPGHLRSRLKMLSGSFSFEYFFPSNSTILKGVLSYQNT